MSDIFVDPTYRCCGFVIVADVAHELAREILYGGEDTSRNHVALMLRNNAEKVANNTIGKLEHLHYFLLVQPILGDNLPSGGRRG